MKIERYDMIVIGAGPAGLSAAIEAAKKGLGENVFDENAKPGGQLFKQIHKFFGSKEHKAKVRGFKIGQELLAEAEEYGVEYLLSDFKKKNGYKRSIELSEEYGLYRQNYCGCVFSKANKD